MIRKYIFLSLVLMSAACGAVSGEGRVEKSGLKLGETTLEEHYLSQKTKELIIAACAGNRARVDKLIADGTNLFDAGRDGVAPIFWMVANNCPVGIKALLEKGVPVESKMPNGETLLWAAAGYASSEVLKLLIDAGANVNVVARETSALVNAIENDRWDNVKLLVRNGADVNWRRGSFSTAATAADVKGHYSTVLFLLENGYSYQIDMLQKRIERSTRAYDAGQEEYRKRVLEHLKARTAHR
jgi:hypothetical protein